MERLQKRFFAGIFLITSATLCLEIVLIRYFSISQHYHFAFLVVSIAFLGYGASGSFLSLFPRVKQQSQSGLLSASALGFSLSVLICFILTNFIPFDLLNISWDVRQIALVFVYYILLSVPFFFAGLVVSSAISTHPNAIHKIYFYDLTGAGCGTILALFVFFPKGDQGTILIISFLALMASVLFKQEPRIRVYSIRFLMLLLLIGLFILSPAWLSFRISPFKSLPVSLQYPQAEHLLTKWNAVSRLDIIQSPAVRHAPGMSLAYQHDLPDQLGLTIDGAGLTAIPSDIPPSDPAWNFLSYLPSSLPYLLLSRPNVLILSPAGGLDIISAYVQGASHIHVSEQNPLIIKILKEDLADTTGGFYENENITFLVSTERASLRHETSIYDLIVFPLTDVFGASAANISGIHEQYSFTKNAFQDVLTSLRTDGMASMSFYILPPPRTEIRALSTWIEILENMGMDPESHLMAIRSWGTISLIIKKSPVTTQNIQILKDFAQERLFDLVYYPGIQKDETNLFNKYAEPVYFNIFSRLLDSDQRNQFYKDYLFRIAPVSDERPFFHNFFKMGKIRDTYSALGKKWLPLLQGELLVVLLLFQSFAAAFLLILLPYIIIQRRKQIKKRIYIHTVLYFGLIGLAYMFIEIAFIQKFILFLGHPVFSSAVIIFSLLSASGLGSFVSRTISNQKLQRMKRVMLFFCACMAGIYLFFLPFLFKTCADFPLLLKIFLTLVVIFPVGFVMGFPFPTGIRILAKKEKKLIPWAWATNAFSSVVHSILALLIAFHGGFSLILGLAAAGYVLTLPFLHFSGHRNKSDS